MLKKFILIIVMLLLAGCGNDSQESDSKIESANQNRRTPEPTATSEGTRAPAITNGEIENIQLENIPDDLTGHLVLTWEDKVFAVPLDGSAAESMAEEVFIRDVYEDVAITGSLNDDDSGQDVSLLNLATGETVNLTTIQDDYFVRVDKRSPDGQWFTLLVEQPDEEPPTDMLAGAFLLETVDYLLFNNEGVQVELPISQLDGDTRVGSGWLTDNTLVVADGIGPQGVSRVLHVDPATGESNELELDDASRSKFIYLSFFYSDLARDEMNIELARYNLELAPGGTEIAFPYTTAPDFSYGIQSVMQGPGSGDTCNGYVISQEPLKELFVPRVLYTGNAYRMSDPVIFDDRVYFVQAISASCQENDLQVELLRIEDFESPVVETLYSAESVFELTDGSLYSVLQHDHYLLWSGVDGDEAQVYLTDLSTEETVILFSHPYQEASKIPYLYSVFE